MHPFRLAVIALGVAIGVPLGGQQRPAIAPGVQRAQGAQGAEPRALAEQECAPWDGPAFGLWIPARALGGARDSWVHLRIWRAARTAAGRYTFPDSTMRVGHVMYLMELTTPKAIVWQTQPRESVGGTVRLLRVGEDRPVVGELDLRTQSGRRITGRFEAAWLATRIACG